MERGLAVDLGERYADATTMLSAVSGLNVVNSWRQVNEPNTLETWVAATADADYAIRLVPRPPAGLELRAQRDLREGAGARTVRKERPPSIPQARQQLRRWLVQVVEGGALH